MHGVELRGWWLESLATPARSLHPSISLGLDLYELPVREIPFLTRLDDERGVLEGNWAGAIWSR